MCGIVGAIAQRNVSEILLEGLRRLEYRGYDSAGLAILNAEGDIQRTRALGKVIELEKAITAETAGKGLAGTIGIAHTRWATHGVPSEDNAHPHMSSDDIVLVHNGIIENYQDLKAELKTQGYVFNSQTDSEVVVHLIHRELQQHDFAQAVKNAISHLEGAYALAIMQKGNQDELWAARQGSPLVIGVGMDEYYIGSDPLALLQVTDRFIYLEEGDLAHITRKKLTILDKDHNIVERDISVFDHKIGTASKGEYKHFMLKETFEQPAVIKQCLEGRISATKVLDQAFGVAAADVLDQVEAVQIIACGTSYHSGMVSKYWIEKYVGIPCQVEVASEFRYRDTVIAKNTLLITISQSGETADTLAALRKAKEKGLLASMTVCNVPGSSLVRESDLCLMTNAGPEIGVASTKAFTTQLTALLLLTVALAKRNGMSAATETEIVEALHQLPALVEKALALDPIIEKMSQLFADKHHSLFLGRGPMYPIAQEGALKLKEISYIHAEAYPAGELKHGPLALVDEDMPIIAVAPKNDLLEKLVSNLEEVKARGGELFVFADESLNLHDLDDQHLVSLPTVPSCLEPIVYIVPLQLLSYHVAVLKGTDVDQPRNLAKSVTVE
ncbi:MAG: glucosamine--fructose-6-phosphate aminotransferase (isomerizing) [Oleispira sp.]|jgi:glucosamine--fructose-6-phosphate aminotransferase (isomerizing)